jgi:hypothetical protein
MLLPTLGGDAVGSDAATGGADRRSAKNAAAPKDQSCEAHTRPGRSTPPRAYSLGRSEPMGDRPSSDRRSPLTALIQPSGPPEATAGSP